MTEYSPDPAIEPEPVLEPVSEDAPPRERPTVTFMGNTYDLASMGALASGVLLLVMCLTCNMGLYCLPIVPLVLGIIGLVTAQQAVDEERTRLWSWIGLGTTGAVLLLIVLGIALYFGLIVFAAVATESWQ